MKIKLGIVEKDETYLRRITGMFNEKYADRVEVYSFTDFAGLLEKAQRLRPDVVLSCEGKDVDPKALPPRCGFAWLSDSQSGKTADGVEIISKYQRADLIYRQVLNIFSEKAAFTTGTLREAGECMTVAFTSPAGGTGTTVAAAAAAVRCSSLGKRVLYLSLNLYGSTDVLFSGQGAYTMSDVIFAIKSRNANLGMKLTGCVKQDVRGVFFFSDAALALDMAELDAEDIDTLLDTLQGMGQYDVLVLDVPFSLERETLSLLGRMDAVVLVSDGEPIAGAKTARAVQALAMKDQGSDNPVTQKLCVFYNKFQSGAGGQLDLPLRTLGSAPFYGHASVQQVIAQLAGIPILDPLL